MYIKGLSYQNLILVKSKTMIRVVLTWLFVDTPPEKSNSVARALELPTLHSTLVSLLTLLRNMRSLLSVILRNDLPFMELSSSASVRQHNSQQTSTTELFISMLGQK